MRNAFTIIELSIVIIIIGVLSAIISFGFEMVEDARRKTLISELAHYQQMINQFQLQYSAVPGDYANAYNFFGTSCAATAVDCNGNGDGIIQWSNTTTQVESLHAWQHLSLSGLLSQSFPGTATVAGQSDINTNVPASAWPNAGYDMYVGATTPIGATGNGIRVAGFTANAGLSAPIMTVDQAWSIDKKMDDGIGGSGKIWGYGVGSASTCVGTDNMNYNLGIKGNVCYIKYLFNP